MFIFIPGYTDSITEKSERKKRKKKGQRNEKEIVIVKKIFEERSKER